mgnify:FL=1|jgi:hypothetical protein
MLRKSELIINKSHEFLYTRAQNLLHVAFK